MATTYTKSPSVIYALDDMDYSYGYATGTIKRSYSASENIVKHGTETLLVEYPADEWGLYTNAYNRKIAQTYVKKPSADSISIDKDAVIAITGTVEIGNRIRISRNYSDPETYNLQTVNGKLYFFVNYTAEKDRGGGDYVPTADQEFTVKGLNLTFTSNRTFDFEASTDFAGGYKNPAKPFTIKTSATYLTKSLKQYEIASGIFYYKETSASTYSSLPFTGNSITVPAGTLQDSKVYDIYFDVTSTTGTTVQCGQAQITTSDGPAVTTAVSPNNEVTYGTVPFRWNYSNITGELQHAFDLQISTDNSDWTDVFTHEVTDQTQVTAEITTSGTVYWRVRGYNQSDVAGAWSASVSFANVVPPQPPVILQIIPGGRIQVRWSATGQISYQMQVLQDDAVVYDSGIVYGTSTLARVNEYLTNGQYTVRVRISNSYGLTSQWSTMNYQQQNQLPNLTVTANYSEARGGVLITVQDDDYEKFYLIRNGILAAKFTGTEYIDQFAAGVTQYRLIGVTSEDNFGQAVFTVTVPTGSARLITEDGQTLSVSERWGNMNDASQTEDIRYSANEFFGATAPEHTFSKMRTKRITRAFYDPDRISAQLLGKIAFYTDEYGNSDWVAILSRSRSDSWIGDDTTIEMELTTRSEVITYDN